MTFAGAINKPLKEILCCSTDIFELSHLGKLCNDIQETHEAFNQYIAGNDGNPSHSESLTD